MPLAIVGIFVAVVTVIVVGTLVVQLLLDAEQKIRSTNNAKRTQEKFTEFYESVKKAESDINTKIQYVFEFAGNRDKKEIQDQFDRLMTQIDNLTTANYGLRRYDPIPDNLRAYDYDDISNTYRSTTSTHYDALDKSNDLIAKINEITQFIRKTGQRVGRLVASLDALEGRIQEVSSQGFKVEEAQNLWNRAKTEINIADAALKDKDYTLADTTSGLAEALIQKAKESVETLPQLRTQATEHYGKLMKLNRETETVLIPLGVSLVEEIKREFAPNCVQNISQNIAKAEALLPQVKQRIDAIPPLLTMDNQKWREAIAEVDKALYLLKQVGKLVKEIKDHLANLRSMRKKIPAEIRAIDNNLDNAWSYALRYFYDMPMDKLQPLLDGVDDNVLKIKAEASKPQPDLIYTRTLINSSRAEIESILTQAQFFHKNALKKPKKSRKLLDYAIQVRLNNTQNKERLA